MSVFQITSFIIIISSVYLHIHSADETFSAVMPHTVTALTGSCVQIPCKFSISDFEDKRNKTKYFYGIWLKSESNGFLAFNSSKNIIRGFSDIQMTGDLTERNCTTVFYNIMKNHSDPYYFRLETQPDVFRATFNANKDDSSKTVRIAVIDSPQPPVLKPAALKAVMEETTVNLSCSAEAPCPEQPPNMSWSYIPQSANITKQLKEKHDKTQSMFSIMTFKVSYKDHKMNISCTATYPRKTSNDSTVETTMTLRVLFPPKETNITIKPSASVSVGTNVTLTCKSKGSPSKSMNYTWYKRGKEEPIALRKQITLDVTQNDAGWYFCTAQNIHGNQSAEDVQLIVVDTFHDQGQDGISMPVIAGFVGGILAVLLLLALGIHTRTRKKTNRGVGKNESPNQAQDENTDRTSTYANVFTMTNQDNKISDDQNVFDCESDHKTGRNSTDEDNNEKGSDVVYAQVHVLHQKPKSISAQHETIYSQLKN